ncbi:MAG TPA: TatD family hydrolase, partial [Saprospiraceae bacterium]|nr:TatD family hydrolase [Saprospiraceae bacterium]
METSQLRFIDTHCHLYAAEFDNDRNDMISRAIDSGIAQMMLPNIDLNTANEMLLLSRQFEGICFPMFGLHPCS